MSKLMNKVKLNNKFVLEYEKDSDWNEDIPAFVGIVYPNILTGWFKNGELFIEDLESGDLKGKIVVFKD